MGIGMFLPVQHISCPYCLTGVTGQTTDYKSVQIRIGLIYIIVWKNQLCLHCQTPLQRDVNIIKSEKYTK